jgi:Rha family phage regulatory protein
MNTDLVTKDLTTTSLMLAKQFNRSHKSILRTIENIIFDMDEKELNRRNIAPVDYIDAKGEARKSYELGEEMSLVVTGRLTGKEALVNQLKLADAFIAMRNFIASGQVAKVEQLEKRLENTHKLSPNTLTAILGRDKSNTYIKEIGYGVLIKAGLAYDEPENVIKHHYKITLEGMDMALGKESQYGIKISEEHHELLRELARAAVDERQIDWTTA